MPPVRLMEILSIDRDTARASANGTAQDVNLDIIDVKPNIGDRVMVCAGFAVHRIDENAEKESLEFIREVMEHESAEEVG